MGDLDLLPVAMDKQAEQMTTIMVCLTSCLTANNISNSQFIKIRDNFITNLNEYGIFIIPIAQSVLEKANDFFDKFENAYENYEDMKEDFPYLLKDSDGCNNGFKYLV